MQARPYTINGSLDRWSSVVKLFYGDKKYVVVKSKDEFPSLKAIESQLAAFLRGGKQNPGSMYIHLFNYVKENPGQVFTVTPILPYGTPYELLQAEQTALNEGKNNPDMLNNNSDAYIPQFNEDTGQYGWISKADVMNFKKWLRRKNR